jgi:hypothetical protein
MTLNAGARDNRAVERRLDVLVFSSAPLDEPVEIAGEVAPGPVPHPPKYRTCSSCVARSHSAAAGSRGSADGSPPVMASR